jgi:hypothetical protein
LLAALVQVQPGQPDIAKRALSEALGAGQYDLALSLARAVPPDQLNTDARLLLVADEIRHHRPDRAQQWLAVKGDTGELTFLSPLVIAWDAAERGDAERAYAALDAINGKSLLTPLADEERALILLKFKRTADAEPFARRAVGVAGAREDRLRLAFADGFLAGGDKARALMILDGMGGGQQWPGYRHGCQGFCGGAERVRGRSCADAARAPADRTGAGVAFCRPAK